MSWGWKIAIGYSAFVVFILFMVFKATQENFELVTPDYYSQELAFQNQIDRSINARDSGEIINLSYKDNGLLVSYPGFTKYQIVKGTVSFFRPSNGELDRTFDWEMNQEGNMFIPGEKFQKGQYLFRAEWEADGKEFYLEKPFFIPE
jgi:hypothetical protein